MENMNKWLIVLGIGSAVFLNQQVQATPFTINGLPFPGSSPTPTLASGGTTIASMSSSLTGLQTGTLFSKVSSGDVNNTLGGLTFTYVLSITSGDVDIFTLTGWTAGMSFFAGENGPGTGSTGFDAPGGGVINFFFNDLAGSVSETLVVQTGATTFTTATELFQDGGQAHALGFGVVPDGGMTVMLLGMALSGLALFRQKVTA